MRLNHSLELIVQPTLLQEKFHNFVLDLASLPQILINHIYYLLTLGGTSYNYVSLKTIKEMEFNTMDTLRSPQIGNVIKSAF